LDYNFTKFTNLPSDRRNCRENDLDVGFSDKLSLVSILGWLRNNINRGKYGNMRLEIRITKVQFAKVCPRLRRRGIDI
jgi:hypothetical protein